MRVDCRRGRPGGRGRGHRRALRQGRHGHARRGPPPSWRGCAPRVDDERRCGVRAPTTSWLLDAARPRARCARDRRASAACTRRTARRSTRRGSSAGLARCGRAARGRDLRADAARRRSSPGAVVHRPRHRARRRSWCARPRATRRALPGSAARSAPLYSLMIATEPLPASRSGRRSGWRGARRSRDLRHMIIYGQRTADDRLAFGGRGAPYHFGSRIAPGFDRTSASTRRSRDVLVDLFPALGRAPRSRTTGAARSACRATGTRRSASTARRGLAWAGGYVGDGVAHHEPRRPHARRSDHRRRRASSTRAAVGRTTARGAGSPSRSAGSASTPAACCSRMPTVRRRAPGSPPGARGRSRG